MGCEREGFETRTSQRNQAAKTVLGSLSAHLQGEQWINVFCAIETVTFTISWAKIPPTTAHTGAISEKQYLKEKAREMKYRGTGRQMGHLEKVSMGCLNENIYQEESIQTTTLTLASRRENSI